MIRAIATSIVIAALPAMVVAGGEAMEKRIPDSLIDQAAEDGPIRVIVQTQVSDGDGGSDAQQMAATEAAAQLMVFHALSPDEQATAEAITDRLLVAELGSASLLALRDSPLVAMVQVDGLATPQPMPEEVEAAPSQPTPMPDLGEGPDLSAPQE
jgi:hypothetical protein